MEDLLIPPPPALADCLQYGLLKTLPGGEYLLPAGLHPIFLLILDGGIQVWEDGGFQPMPVLSLCGGTRSIRRARAEPGTRILTLSLKPGRLSCLVDFPALEIMEGRVEAMDFLDQSSRADLGVVLGQQAEGAAEAGVVAAFFQLLTACRQRRLNNRESRSDLILPLDWASHTPRSWAEQLGISQRQFERRFLANYGQSLRSFHRQTRTSGLVMAYAMHLSRCHEDSEDVAATSPPDSWAALAADHGYYDQAHLHHDLQQFTGHTPGQLAAGITARNPAFWPYLMAADSLPRLFGPSGY
jgi:AraC-like DNA-binding protein